MLLAFATACSTSESVLDDNEGLSILSADSLKKHVAILASDEFMGRKPFTEGETKTIHSISGNTKCACCGYIHRYNYIITCC